MKLPLKPKPIQGLMEKYASELPKLLSMGIGPVIEGKYLPWDTVFHLDQPSGLESEEWWLAIKLARQPLLRPAPLKDANGKAFAYALPDRVLRMLHEIDSKARGSIELPAQVTNKDMRERYIVKSLIEESITSSQLEGASTTRQVASDMIVSGRKPTDKSEQMIFNNYKAISSIREIKNETLTPSRVLNLQKIMTERTLDDLDAAGRLQVPGELRVHVADNKTQEILHRPPPAEQLPKRLEEMCDFANAENEGEEFIHPVIRAIILHFWLAYDHPFVDGNGRTARALFYWSMLSQGYWLFEFVSISRILKEAPSKYGKSYLYTETDDNDLTYFIDYQLEVIIRAINDLWGYLERKAREVHDIEKELKNSSQFNYRQLSLLTDASQHPGAEYSIKSHQESHRVAYATARADLYDLEEKGLLVKQQRGKKQIFLIPEELKERLRKVV